MIISVPIKGLGEVLSKKKIKDAEIRLDDGRHISADQRKKAYATIRDIASYTGYLPEEQKEWLKYLHIVKTGCGYFSLADCSMDTAREFINTILEYAVENGIPLTDNAVERTDDINRYLYFCIKHKKCAICGRDGENTSLGCYRHGKQPQYPRRFGPSKDMPMPGASHKCASAWEGELPKNV